MSTIHFYQADERDQHMTSLIERIERADHEILVLNCPAAEPPDFMELVEARRVYFDALLRRVYEGGIAYTRVLQVAGAVTGSVTDALRTGYDSLYREHFAQMAKGQEAGAKLELRVMPLTVPATLVLVDDTYLSWEISELRQPGNGAVSWDSHYSLEIVDADGPGLDALRRHAFRAWFTGGRPVNASEIVV